MLRKIIGFIIGSIGFTSIINGQTLFTYGNFKVVKQEFLAAYNKNPSTVADRKQALKQYLDLYINYKLKVQSAYESNLNLAPTFKNESDNYRKQLTETFLNEEAGIKKLMEEAILRIKKDIHVAQIFIAFGKDSSSSFKQAQKAYQTLKAGKSFEDVLLLYSTDSSAIKSKGDIGFITAFTLPYEIENIIYSLPTNGFSQVYKSKYGYHIFKNISERPALGRRKVAQIFLATAPDETDENKKRRKDFADSVYQLVSKGVPFEAMVGKYSNDLASSNNGGIMPEVGIGQYEKDFENKIFGLKKKDELTKPFASKYGFHILRLKEIIHFDEKNPDQLAELKQKIESSDRLQISKRNLIKKWQTISKYNKADFNQEEVNNLIDSIVFGKTNFQFKHINDSTTTLFTFSNEKRNTKDLIDYLKSQKQIGNNFTSKKPTEILQEFIQYSSSEYYKNHLDNYNATFKKQIKEFDDANLLFAAMDKNVWNKATEDSIGLKQYFENHRNNYTWGKGISAVMITTSTKDLANRVHNSLISAPTDWRNTVTSFGNAINTDSGRYEESTLPVKYDGIFKKGEVVPVLKNIADSSFTILYVTNVFDNTTQRSFEEAKGLVINDYQQVLEDKWLKALKAKYPVRVIESIWNTIK